MKIKLLLAALASLAASWAAAGAGTTTADFLNIGLGPRAVAMGGSFAALADDASAIYWNPAGLSQLQQQEAGFSHTQWIDGISYEYLLYAYPYPRLGGFGASYSTLGKGGISSYDENGASLGSVSVNDSAATVAWGRKVLDRLSLGVSAKWINESLAGYSASGYAVDLGALATVYEDPFRRVTAGFSARNLGTHGSLVSASEPLPRTVVLGLGFKGLSERLSADVEGVFPQGPGGFLTLGGEYWVHPMLAVRAGYQSAADAGSGFSAGLGVRVQAFQFDYALSDLGALGFAHRGGVTYRFGSLGGGYYEQGLKLMREGNYAEAFLKFNKILTSDPGNRAAVLRMKECRDRIQEELKEAAPLPAEAPK